MKISKETLVSLTPVSERFSTEEALRKTQSIYCARMTLGGTCDGNCAITCAMSLEEIFRKVPAENPIALAVWIMKQEAARNIEKANMHVAPHAKRDPVGFSTSEVNPFTEFERTL